MLVEDYTLAPGFSTVNTSLYCHIFTPCTVEPLCVYIVYTIRTQPAVLHREMSLMHGPILYTVLCMWLVQQTVWVLQLSGGSCSLVAEQWHGMPVALGSIPGGSTFLSCSFAISEVFGLNGMIQRSLIRSGLIGLWTKIIGVPSIGLPAVIPLTFSMISRQCPQQIGILLC